MKEFELNEVENGGERISELAGHDRNLQIHKDVYEFVRHLALDKEVVDLGSGSGYGAALLAESARSVRAFEFSDTAVAFSRQRYARRNLTYSQADLNLPLHMERADLVFSSNVFEHLTDVRQAIETAQAAMRANGTFFLAIPCILESDRLEQELLNPYHFANFSQAFWFDTLRACFEQVDGYIQLLNHSDDAFRADATLAKSLSSFEPVDRCYFGARHFIPREYANLCFICKGPRQAVLWTFDSCPVSSVRRPVFDDGATLAVSAPLSGNNAITTAIPVSGRIGGAEIHVQPSDVPVGWVEVRLGTRRFLFDLQRGAINGQGFVPLCLDCYHDPVHSDGLLPLTISARGLVGFDAFRVRLAKNGQPWARVYEAMAPL